MLVSLCKEKIQITEKKALSLFATVDYIIEK